MPQNKRSRDQEDDAASTTANDDAPVKKKPVNSVEDTKPSAGDDLDNSGTNPTPIFLKKTYKMIDSCDPDICSWSSDGLSFIVKDPEKFAAEIIPQYFDHNKFSSFARQLNFYGFRKIQTKPIKNSDFDETTAKHVTFFNEKFRRGRQDLLREITRSTRSVGGGGGANATSGGKDADSVRATVTALEQRVAQLETKLIESNKRVDMIVMELTASRSQQQQAMFSAQMAAASMGAMPPGLLPPALPLSNVAAAGAAPELPASMLGDAAACTLENVAQKSFGSGVGTDSTDLQPPLPGSELMRAFSMASARSRQLSDWADVARATSGSSKTNGGNKASKQKTAKPADENATASNATATLPPHPKQKNVPPQLPTEVQIQAAQAQGAPANAALALPIMLRNAWENDFFNSLMADGAAGRAASLASFAGNPALGTPGGLSALAVAQQQMGYPAYLQNRAIQNAMAMGGPSSLGAAAVAALDTAQTNPAAGAPAAQMVAAAGGAPTVQMNAGGGAPATNKEEV